MVYRLLDVVDYREKCRGYVRVRERMLVLAFDKPAVRQSEKKPARREAGKEKVTVSRHTLPCSKKDDRERAVPRRSQRVRAVLSL